MLAAMTAAPAAPITGKLIVAGANPADWSVVALTEPVSELPQGATPTPVAADGSFSIAAAPAGKGYVAAYRGRWLDFATLTNPRLDLTKVDAPLELKTKAPRARVELAVSTVAGPLPAGTRVHLYGPYGRYDASTGGTALDASGAAVYENLPLGTYSAWVDTVHGATSPTGPAALVFQGLEVKAGAEPLRLPLKLTTGGAVSGKLQLAAGQGAAEGWVVAVQTGAEPRPGATSPEADSAGGAATGYSWTTVAKDGTFTLGQLPTGPLSLDIRRPGEARAWSSLDVEVKEGQTLQLEPTTVPAASWRYVTNDGWADGEFRGGVPAYSDSARVYIPVGKDMSGITWKGDVLPQWNYEVTLQGMRTLGNDFWCGLTFRVGADPCTLVLGGWGGAVTGLSSIDGEDASQNPTSTFSEYANWRWYRAKIRVTKDRITGWVDHKQIIDLPLADHKIGIRWEVEPSVPFGIATWCTGSAVRDIRVRPLP